MRRVVVSKIASTTARLGLSNVLDVRIDVPPAAGNVVVVEALAEKAVYSHLELPNGRMARVLKGDVIAGVLGGRCALRGYVGRVPERLEAGCTLSVLNLGGVIGVCTSGSPDVGEALPVRYIGTASDAEGPLNIARGSLPTSGVLAGGVNLVLVTGTCMNSGKTMAACEIIQALVRRGRKVGGAKFAGVGCLKDQLNMEDHGAVSALSFVDCGVPSTAGFEDITPIARGVVNAIAAAGVSTIVCELGDGIIGGYGLHSVLSDPGIRGSTRALVMCANDLVGAWGAREYLDRMGLKIDVFSGPATDSEAGTSYIARSLGAPAINARSEGERLGRFVEDFLR